MTASVSLNYQLSFLDVILSQGHFLTWLSVDVLGLEILGLQDDDGEGVLGGVVGQADQQLAQLLLDRRVEGLPVAGFRRKVHLAGKREH